MLTSQRQLEDSRAIELAAMEEIVDDDGLEDLTLEAAVDVAEEDALVGVGFDGEGEVCGVVVGLAEEFRLAGRGW